MVTKVELTKADKEKVDTIVVPNGDDMIHLLSRLTTAENSSGFYTASDVTYCLMMSMKEQWERQVFLEVNSNVSTRLYTAWKKQDGRVKRSDVKVKPGLVTVAYKSLNTSWGYYAGSAPAPKAVIPGFSNLKGKERMSHLGDIMAQLSDRELGDLGFEVGEHQHARMMAAQKEATDLKEQLIKYKAAAASLQALG